MIKKIWPDKGIFSMPIIRELAVVLIIKLILIIALKFFYFSQPVPFNADHLFGKVADVHNTITPKNSIK
ncbi:MAG: hypothetical protein KAH18_09670 [Psychromonas sp.]|nr:hypothetical protein [Psychromonas sp.]